MNIPATRKDFMIVNMGPHHPSMHGVLRLILSIDGEYSKEIFNKGASEVNKTSLVGKAPTSEIQS